MLGRERVKSVHGLAGRCSFGFGGASLPEGKGEIGTSFSLTGEFGWAGLGWGVCTLLNILFYDTCHF